MSENSKNQEGNDPFDEVASAAAKSLADQFEAQRKDWANQAGSADEFHARSNAKPGSGDMPGNSAEDVSKRMEQSVLDEMQRRASSGSEQDRERFSRAFGDMKEGSVDISSMMAKFNRALQDEMNLRMASGPKKPSPEDAETAAKWLIQSLKALMEMLQRFIAWCARLLGMGARAPNAVKPSQLKGEEPLVMSLHPGGGASGFRPSGFQPSSVAPSDVVDLTPINEVPQTAQGIEFDKSTLDIDGSDLVREVSDLVPLGGVKQGSVDAVSSMASKFADHACDNIADIQGEVLSQVLGQTHSTQIDPSEFGSDYVGALDDEKAIALLNQVIAAIDNEARCVQMSDTVLDDMSLKFNERYEPLAKSLGVDCATLKKRLMDPAQPMSLLLSKEDAEAFMGDSHAIDKLTALRATSEISLLSFRDALADIEQTQISDQVRQLLNQALYRNTELFKRVLDNSQENSRLQGLPYGMITKSNQALGEVISFDEFSKRMNFLEKMKQSSILNASTDAKTNDERLSGDAVADDRVSRVLDFSIDKLKRLNPQHADELDLNKGDQSKIQSQKIRA
jgi:hypothetical protein